MEGSKWQGRADAASRAARLLVLLQSRKVPPSSPKGLNPPSNKIILTWPSEILPTLGLRSSGLEDFTYPDSFPAPPSTLSSTRPAAGDYYAWSPMSDDQQRVEEERSWLYYLAEISLRRTIKDTMAVLYRKGETYWLQNEQLLVRQYDEFEKEISQL